MTFSTILLATENMGFAHYSVSPVFIGKQLLHYSTGHIIYVHCQQSGPLQGVCVICL